jgi:hypothetical protein
VTGAVEVTSCYNASGGLKSGNPSCHCCRCGGTSMLVPQVNGSKGKLVMVVANLPERHDDCTQR